MISEQYLSSYLSIYKSSRLEIDVSQLVMDISHRHEARQGTIYKVHVSFHPAIRINRKTCLNCGEADTD